ncbi:hypothetical protein [Actinopolymorpha rutila]|uniref:Uncharacterized protein n=1 Tax=Actinopolymorpha rutila TaxID=446787 RepID=A0A852ZLH6_9ACTN|nr:hypothetical protein [Actinopolymorpha rutila]NYH92738.1 hypothetical protein [Actinopolymorpha rutila]
MRLTTSTSAFNSRGGQPVGFLSASCQLLVGTAQLSLSSEARRAGDLGLHRLNFRRVPRHQNHGSQAAACPNSPVSGKASTVLGSRRSAAQESRKKVGVKPMGNVLQAVLQLTLGLAGIVAVVLLLDRIEDNLVSGRHRGRARAQARGWWRKVKRTGAKVPEAVAPATVPVAGAEGLDVATRRA